MPEYIRVLEVRLRPKPFPSMMLAKGVPDKYAMKRLGQSSPNMIKDIYQHLYESKEKEVADTVSDAFKSIYDTKYDTNPDK